MNYFIKHDRVEQQTYELQILY